MIISREDEKNFPEFDNVDDARDYFEKRYGNAYNFGEKEAMESPLSLELYGGFIYFDDVDGQPVQIGENGFVHVVY